MVSTEWSGEGGGTGGRHRLGDGHHLLPVYRLTAEGMERVGSEGCILLLFFYWAHARGYDATGMYGRAHPEVGGLRSDELLLYRPWVEIPARIDARLLCRDLESMGEHALVDVIAETRSGRWRPPRAFSHWVVTDGGQLAGEARDLDPPDRPDARGQHFCFVRLFAMPELAEWGYTRAHNLKLKRLR